jgi:hypothetical protein
MQKFIQFLQKVTSLGNNKAYHLFCDLIEDVKYVAIDVKKHKNYIQNNENWDHNNNSV